MPLELFVIHGSPYAWRVQLALEIKRLSYTTHVLSYSAAALKAPEYLALNPRGRVPTLRDGDLVLYESLAILAYIDRKYPAPPLFGITPESTGTVMRIVSEYTAYVDHAVEAFILPIYFGSAEEKADQVREAAATLAEELGRYEATLSRSPYLAGDALTAADLVVFPHVMSILRAASKEAAIPFDLVFMPLLERHPKIASWVSRIEALPGYSRTYPPNWT